MNVDRHRCRINTHITYIICREVRIIIEGVDKFGNLFATVLYPEGEQALNLAEQLTSAGLAKVSQCCAQLTRLEEDYFEEVEMVYILCAALGLLSMWRPILLPKD